MDHRFSHLGTGLFSIEIDLSPLSRGNPYTTRIPTATWKSLRLSDVFHWRNGTDDPQLKTGILIVTNDGNND